MSFNPSTRQERLAAVSRATGGSTIRVDDTMRALKISRQHASRLLAGWHNQGLIRRVAHGLYVPILPWALGYDQVLDDPCILVPELYEPGYVGGFSALEDWDLTEQMFHSICVLTSRRVSYGHHTRGGVRFNVRYIPKRHIFGTETRRWEHRQYLISDPYKTLLDCINDLGLGGGLQHVTHCLNEFRKVYGRPSDYDALLDCAIKFKNGALFKKLGFFAELLEFNSSFVAECRKHITSGYAILDNYLERDDKLVTRWNLWVPKYMVDFKSWLT